ncbi:MAG: hypothetical protein ACTSQB_03550, partial [Candidatus Heimdallarchaeota archaeon]
PMVIGACAINDQIAQEFKKNGIRDSKLITSYRDIHQYANFVKRVSLAWNVQVISAQTLTNFNKNGITMDEAEALAFFRAIEDIATKVETISTFQVDNFQAVGKLQKLLKDHPKLEHVKLIVLPKAESKYISVSGGSILARSRTLLELEVIRSKYGRFGSGNTSDKKTIAWLKSYFKSHGTWPDIVRTYWKTTSKIEKELSEEEK